MKSVVTKSEAFKARQDCYHPCVTDQAERLRWIGSYTDVIAILRKIATGPCEGIDEAIEQAQAWLKVYDETSNPLTPKGTP